MLNPADGKSKNPPKFHITCSNGFPKTSQGTRISNLLQDILNNHELLSLVTVSNILEGDPGHFILHCAPPIPIICSEELEHMEGPTTRGRWMPAAAEWRERITKRKSFSMWGPGGTACSEMSGADCSDRLFSLVFPFYFLASLKSNFTELHVYPRPQLFPKELPLHPARTAVFWLCCCCMGHVSESSLGNIPVVFPPPICSKPFKGTKSPSALQPENQQHPLQHNLLPCVLDQVGKERKIPYENWPKLPPPHIWWEEQGKITWEFSNF